MGSVNALFDTNILIDYLSGIEAARIELARHRNRAISVITWMEVMAGVQPQHEATTRNFLNTFHVLPITGAVAERAVVARRLRRLKLPDAVILATAEMDNRLLITRNIKDFPSDDPAIRVPYRL